MEIRMPFHISSRRLCNNMRGPVGTTLSKVQVFTLDGWKVRSYATFPSHPCRRSSQSCLLPYPYIYPPSPYVQVTTFYSYPSIYPEHVPFIQAQIPETTHVCIGWYPPQSFPFLYPSWSSHIERGGGQPARYARVGLSSKRLLRNVNLDLISGSRCIWHWSEYNLAGWLLKFCRLNTPS